MDEPSVDETIEILKGLRPVYETFHGVALGTTRSSPPSSSRTATSPTAAMPDKAIDLIDEAAARAKVKRLTPPDEIRRLQRLRDQARTERDAAVDWREYERASLLGDEERRLSRRDRAAAHRVARPPRRARRRPSAWTTSPGSSPAGRASRWRTSRSGNRRACWAWRRASPSASSASATPSTPSVAPCAVRRPAWAIPTGRSARYLFVGPTGVGKTEVGRALAEYLFTSEDALIRFDMSEFGEYHTVSRLVGAPPGYVGYENAGELSEAVRRRPYAVVLFDEVDKAHPQVLTVLLQIMDSGHLTDAQGRKVNFKNTIILLTANFGTERLRKAGLGFRAGPDAAGMTAEDVRSVVSTELKRHLSPEFINRLDDVIVFEPLTRDDMRAIASRMLMRERDGRPGARVRDALGRRRRGSGSPSTATPPSTAPGRCVPSSSSASRTRSPSRCWTGA